MPHSCKVGAESGEEEGEEGEELGLQGGVNGGSHDLQGLQTGHDRLGLCTHIIWRN